jgi:hypothetical protein
MFIWISARYVKEDDGTFRYEVVDGTYRRTTPRVVHGRGAAKRYAKKQQPKEEAQ